MFFFSLALAILIDRIWGWPDRFLRILGHPVIWVGRLITYLDYRYNKGSEFARLIKGTAIVIGLILMVFFLGSFIQLTLFLSLNQWVANLVLALLIWPLLAVRSMQDHIRAVLLPLQNKDLPSAQKAVAMIIGRNSEQLDENGIRRAAIESLAENTSDGLVAPLFWAALMGLPGIMVYKLINTLDSMIGYRNNKYLYFGKAAARIDDVVNFIPARLTACLYMIVGQNRGLFRFKIISGIRGELQDHRSINAGWPEGVMAKLLDIRLSGPRYYDGHLSDEAWLNKDAPDPNNHALETALTLFHRLVIFLMICFFLLGFGYFIVYAT